MPLSEVNKWAYYEWSNMNRVLIKTEFELKRLAVFVLLARV